jgi:hypothetical protein
LRSKQYSTDTPILQKPRDESRRQILLTISHTSTRSSSLKKVGARLPLHQNLHLTIYQPHLLRNLKPLNSPRISLRIDLQMQTALDKYVMRSDIKTPSPAPHTHLSTISSHIYHPISDPGNLDLYSHTDESGYLVHLFANYATASITRGSRVRGGCISHSFTASLARSL